MNLVSNMLREDNIILYSSAKSKTEIFSTLAEHLFNKNIIISKEDYIRDLQKRESEGPTALGDLLAIPHCKSQAVKETTLVVLVLEKPISNWAQEDPSEKVQLIFTIVATKDANDVHIDILQELGSKLSSSSMIENLLKSSSPKQFLDIFTSTKQENTPENISSTDDIILAVTACPSGMAHTYMAAEKLKQAAQEMGISLFVETQGAGGIDSEITNSTLQNAKSVIFATEVTIKNEERFSHLPIINVGVTEAIKRPKQLLERALAQQSTGKDFVPNETGEISKKDEVKRALMTGISYAVPVIVGGSMTLAIAVLIAQAFGLQELYGQEGSWLWLYRKYGGNILGQLMVPMIAGYISFALSDKPGLAPGMAAGVAANMVGAGFLGGMLGGFIAGYIMRLIKKIRVSNSLNGFLTFWLYPVLGIFSVGTVMLFVVGPPVSALNTGLTNWLNDLSGSNAILLGAMIGGFVSFDLGGPVNKAAYAFCLGALANGNYVPYATFASVKMVSAFASTFATMWKPQLFKDFEIESGKSTWILGLAGITEGAIPIMLEDPIRVITSFVIGSMVTGAIVAYFAIGLQVPGAGIFSLFLLEPNTLLETVIASSIWFFSAVLGALISTVILVSWKEKATK